MRVRMKTTKAGPAGVAFPGDAVTVDDVEGRQLIDGGFATLISESADETEDSSIPIDEIDDDVDEPTTLDEPDADPADDEAEPDAKQSGDQADPKPKPKAPAGKKKPAAK